MGYLSDRFKATTPEGAAPRSHAVREAAPESRSRARWSEVFGRSNKEDAPPPSGSAVRGTRSGAVPGAHGGRSLVTTEAAYVRFLQALRTKAPGGWSDDRWEQTRQFTGIKYVAIHRKASMMAQAEFSVYRRDPTHPDGKRPVTQDEVTEERDGPYDLVKLLERPNPKDSFGQWMYRLTQQWDLTGTALNMLVPNALGTPIEQYVIPTSTAVPQPIVHPDYPQGYYRIQPVYPYGPFSSYPSPMSSVGAAIPGEWMVNFQYPHPLLFYDGYAPLTGLRSELDSLDSVNRSRWYSMQKAIRPSGVLNFDGMEGAETLPAEEIDRIHAEWEQFQGPENAGAFIVSTPGGKIEPWGANPVDMDYPQGWEQLTSFGLAGFGITKPAAGMIDDASYSTLFATLKQLYLLTLQPMCDTIAAILTRQLAPFFGDDLIVEIRCKRIDDHEITNQKIDKLGTLLGKPKSFIKLALRMMEIEFTEELVDEMAKGGQEQQAGAPGGGPPGSEATETEEGDLNEAPAKERRPSEVEASRPTPGSLGRGSLGPRKALTKALLLRDKYRRSHRPPSPSRNGHHVLNGVH